MNRSGEEEYDYVVVGGGTAGCVVAARLAARSGVSVLLLEAGPPDERPEVRRTDIAAMTSLWADGESAWPYRTVPQPGLHGRVVQLTQGRMLGGGSSINAMMHVRGNPRDFEHWDPDGTHGWSHRDVLPYFKKSEDYEQGATEHRGSGGPLSVVDYHDPSPVSEAFVRAAAQVLGTGGAPIDYNGPSQEAGAFYYQSTRTKDGWRSSTAEAYLRPAAESADPAGSAESAGLRVRTGAHAVAVRFDGGRAVAVDYRAHDQGPAAPRLARVRREIIVACGALASPKLLMLSGLGPAAQLRKHGIDVVADLPAVGRNLQDHLVFGVGYQSLRDLEFPQLLAEAGLFARTGADPEAASPDLQIFFGPVQFVEERHRIDGPGFTAAPVLVRPASRGTVALASADPFAPAVIDPRYLSRGRDVETLIRGIGLAREIVATRHFDPFRGRELAPGDSVTSRADLADYVRSAASTVWHPAGTCRMGPAGPDSVVGYDLAVHGVDGLRVADASVMPLITTGNTNAATVMIAEKAADLIPAVG